jgi:hypothetical protein
MQNGFLSSRKPLYCTLKVPAHNVLPNCKFIKIKSIFWKIPTTPGGILADAIGGVNMKRGREKDGKC